MSLYSIIAPIGGQIKRRRVMADSNSIDFNAHAGSGKDAHSCLPPPVFDNAPFLAELQNCGLTTQQATEFLATLVPLLWHFVDLGFRVDISKLLLSCADSDALDSGETSKMETPSKAESEVAAQ